MTAPRLEIRVDRIHHNARTLVHRLASRGIQVTGVTKATLGSPEIARELIRAGVSSLGESRIENIESMRRAGIAGTIALIRSPMLSQASRVVAHADLSLNTELDTIARLSAAAQDQQRSHGIVLMVELGDLREGIMPGDLESVVRKTLRFPNIVLRGIGTNLACQSGASPDRRNMEELSRLAFSLEATFGATIDIVSGGNSANLDWASTCPDVGRVNNLRLGESILLGRETLRRHAIEGLYTDAIALVAEVIESKTKPSKPWGDINQTAFGLTPPRLQSGSGARSILALGRQDVDPAGLEPPGGMRIIGASSDHLIIDTGSRKPSIGSEITFRLNYSALVSAMTSPFVTRVYVRGGETAGAAPTSAATEKAGS